MTTTNPSPSPTSVLRALIAEARSKTATITPPPWDLLTHNDQLAVVNTREQFFIALIHPDDTHTEPGPSNAALIVWAPAAVTALADAAERVADLAESGAPSETVDVQGLLHDRTVIDQIRRLHSPTTWIGRPDGPGLPVCAECSHPDRPVTHPCPTRQLTDPKDTP